MKLKKVSLRTLNKQIQASNDTFNSAKRQEKRVFLAQDVIARIRAEQFEAEEQVFVEVSGNSSYDEEESFKSHLDKGNITHCSVCAKGGMFLAYIGRVNNLSGEEVESASIDDGSLEETLQSIFTKKQLDLIEVAFEGEIFSWTDDSISSEQLQRAIAFFNRTEYDSANERLIKICENIIRNKGNFKL